MEGQTQPLLPANEETLPFFSAPTEAASATEKSLLPPGDSRIYVFLLPTLLIGGPCLYLTWLVWQKKGDLLMCAGVLSAGTVCWVLACFLIEFFYSLWREQQRCADLANLAITLNMQFTNWVDPIFQKNLPPFKLLKKGRRQEISNLLVGKYQNRVVALFDFAYRLGSGRRRRSYHHRTLWLDKPLQRPAWPECVVRPRQFWHRWAGWLGLKTVAFPNHVPFSQQYTVFGQLADSIRNLLPQSTLDLLVKKKNFGFELQSHSLLCYYINEWLLPDQVERVLVEGQELLDQLLNSESTLKKEGAGDAQSLQ